MNIEEFQEWLDKRIGGATVEVFDDVKIVVSTPKWHLTQLEKVKIEEKTNSVFVGATSDDCIRHIFGVKK